MTASRNAEQPPSNTERTLSSPELTEIDMAWVRGYLYAQLVMSDASDPDPVHRLPPHLRAYASVVWGEVPL